MSTRPGSLERALPTKARAYAYTKQRVLSSAFPGGSMLSEGEIADALGVSRTPVREAFLQLEAEGLLRLYPKRGALVVPLSADVVLGVIEARALIEHAAVDKVIERKLDVVERLEASIARQRELAAGRDAEGFAEADRDFHRIIMGASRNPVLLGFYDSLRDQQRRMISLSLSRDPNRTRDVIDQHRELTAAIAAGDATGAHDILERHLSRHVREVAGIPT
jgi:DNA-binding GntR family transcriptional regulator